MASGTFNPLSRVLFTFHSHYLFSIGPVLVFRLVRDTPHHSSCSPKQFYSQVSVIHYPLGSGWWTHSRNGALTLRGMPFQATWPQRSTTCQTGSGPQEPMANIAKHLSESHPGVCRHFSGWSLPASIAFTEGITVVFFSFAD